MATLLVVHADPAVLGQVERALAPLGHPISTAVDGVDALSLIERLPPALVITDLALPRADGVTLVKALRARPLTAGVPVLVLSSRRDSATPMEALALGARYCIPLPLIDEDLRDKVEALLLGAADGRTG